MYARRMVDSVTVQTKLSFNDNYKRQILCMRISIWQLGTHTNTYIRSITQCIIMHMHSNTDIPRTLDMLIWRFVVDLSDTSTCIENLNVKTIIFWNKDGFNVMRNSGDFENNLIFLKFLKILFVISHQHLLLLLFLL